MGELTLFTYQSHQVRTVLVDGEPWFVAADVARILGYRDAFNMARRLDKEDRGTRLVSTPSGDQEMTVISEAGLYVAILGSQVPGAREFKRWITHEVIPTIRRTGRYESGPTKPMTELEMAQRYLAALRREQQLKAELEAAAPKAHSWDVLASGTGDYSVADAAKVLSRDPALKLGRDRLFTILAEHGWTYRQRADQRWRPYQAAVDAARLSELPASHYHPRTGELVIDPPQVRVTVKGLQELHRRLGGVRPLQLDQPMLVEATP